MTARVSHRVAVEVDLEPALGHAAKHSGDLDAGARRLNVVEEGKVLQAVLSGVCIRNRVIGRDAIVT